MPTIRLKALLSGSKPAAAEKPAAPAKPAAAQQPPAAPTHPAGRVTHDSRGNAVWDWAAKTARAALESTSLLLKKLEVPGLKLEDTNDRNRELEIQDECPGGGYDPYGRVNHSSKVSKPSIPAKSSKPFKK